MFELIIGWLILSVAIWGTAAVLPGVRIEGFVPAIAVAAVFAVLNFFFGWIVFILIGIGTLGLGFILFFITQWIVNALMLSLTDRLMSSIRIDGFAWSMAAALLISVFASVGQWLVY